MNMTVQELPINSPLWIVSGTTGDSDDRITWLVGAYTSQDYAERASNYLVKLANRFDALPRETDSANVIFNQIRQLDPNVVYPHEIDKLYYFIQPVTFVC